MIREIIVIDEERCDGCGLCVPACAEGALQVVDGKVRLISDRLCDGLGACLGHCPRGALRVEHRGADAFSEQAVAQHLNSTGPRQGDNGRPGHAPATAGVSAAQACPAARFNRLAGAPAEPQPQPDDNRPHPGQTESALTHWPVQLRLLPPTAPLLQGARLLLAADCVPFALPDFHRELLQGRAVAVACPKLDQVESYLDKLTEMIRVNDFAEITVARMEVPCCGGLMMLASKARQLSGKDVPIYEVIVSTRGQVVARREHTAEAVS